MARRSRSRPLALCFSVLSALFFFGTKHEGRHVGRPWAVHAWIPTSMTSTTTTLRQRVQLLSSSSNPRFLGDHRRQETIPRITIRRTAVATTRMETDSPVRQGRESSSADAPRPLPLFTRPVSNLINGSTPASSSSSETDSFSPSPTPSSTTNPSPSSSSSSGSNPTTAPVNAGSSSTTTTGSSTVMEDWGDWEELHDNFLLRPSLDRGPPRALIHFLGGALVGASPQVSYRYLLERLAQQGYLIVATPYTLSFDHLATCDAILARFERIATLLARTYGPLPVVGVGHSCGALLQLLITSLFPDTPRAANALLAFNNKPVSEAVPLFEEVVAPFFTYVAARNDTSRSSGSQIITVGLQLTKAAALGELPSDDLLNRATQLLVPPVWRASGTGPSVPLLQIPGALREAVATLTSPARTALSKTGLRPVVSEVLDALEQIPSLIDEVADGARDFIPSPVHVKAAARRAYRARRTLVLKYTDDTLDESDDIEEWLRAASEVIRMKRPMLDCDVQRRDVPGGHATPLLAPPLDWAQRAETLLGAAVAKERLQYVNADRTVDEIVLWLDESNL